MNSSRMLQLSRVLAVLAVGVSLLTACATTGQVDGGRPRLIVFLAVDGLPQWQVVDYRDQLAPDGFARFLDRGTWFSQARYGHSFTVTATGHAAMLTGAYPHRTGIIGNEWRDRISAQPVYNTGDEAYTYLDNRTEKLAGTSPRNLLVESVGDVLRKTDSRSKVIAISGKDRGAILPAGKSGTAYMYMADSGRFASSTYYMQAHPGWVAAFNNARPADRYFKSSWTPLLPEVAYARSVPDERSWYAKGGKLPKPFGEGQEKPGAGFYASLLPSPFGDALTLDFARAAIAGESLGKDEAPDILAISLSSHDYINHAYGAESRLSHDHLLQLDRMLEAFFADLDRTVGKDNYVAVLTADHGFMPAPEYSATLGRDAGRESIARILARLNEGLVARFGAGQWARAWSANGVLLDNALIAQRQLDRRTFEDEARRLLLTEKSIIEVFTRAMLENRALLDSVPFLREMRKTYYPERSPDLLVVARPYWMFGSAAATHGSPHDYDRHVPILFYGPRWVGAARVDTAVEVVDIAPTLARLLQIAAPPANEGKALPLR